MLSFSQPIPLQPLTLLVFSWLSVTLVPHAVLADQPRYLIAIAATEAGDFFLGDRKLPGVWKLKGESLSPFFKGSKKFRTPLNAVRCLAIDRQGRLLAGDSATREVYRFDAEGKPVPLTAGAVGIPNGIAVNQAGDYFIADLETHQVKRFLLKTGKLETFVKIEAPRGVAVDSKDRVWVLSQGKDQLLRASAKGELETIIKGRPFKFLNGLAIDANDIAYICDSYTQTIWKISAAGVAEKWHTGKPLVHPTDMVWQGDRLLVVDPRADAVFEFDRQGKSKVVKWKVPGQK